MNENENENEESTNDTEPEFMPEDDYDPNKNYPKEEEEFLKVKEILGRNDRFGHFSGDFSRLLDAWRSSHRREVYFVEMKKSLKFELDDVKIKLEASEKLILEDYGKITKLTEEMIGALRLVDESHAREQETQRTIDILRTQVNNLSQELDLNKKMGSDQEHEAGALAKNKEALVKEKERLMAELLVAKGKLNKAHKIQREFENQNEEANRKINECATELEALKNEVAKEKRQKEKIESDLTALGVEIAEKDKNIQGQTVNIQNYQQANLKLEQIIKEQKNIIDKLTKDLADAGSAQKITKTELELQHANIARLTRDLATKTHDLKMKEEECQRLKLDEQKVRKLKDNVQKKLEIIESQKVDGENEKEKLLGGITLMEKELNELKKQIVSDRKIMEALKRERELIAKTAHKTTAVTTEQQAKLALQDVEKKRLEEEINDLVGQIGRHQKEIKVVISESEQLTNEVTQAKKRAQVLDEQVKLMDGQNSELKKKLMDAECKTKLHVTLFEQVRTERNKVSKRLVDAEGEINELQHKLKVKSYEVEQLKEDMTTKENMLVKGEFNMQKVTKEKESLRLERQKMSTELKEGKERIEVLTQEERRLQKLLEEADEDKIRLTKELHQVLNEKEAFVTQITRRNEETNLLYEKIFLLEDILKKGETEYQRRLDDIRLLKIEVKRLRQEKALISRNMDNAVDLRREMFHLERDFTRERLKSRALEDELSNPLNVHRWRKLEGSDPTTYELIQKVRLLQKRLISASEEALKRESELADCQKKMQELESLQVRHPGPEIAEKLHTTQVTLREKNIRIKALQAELSMFEEQISLYKIDLEYKNKEIAEVKRKYFALKRREQKVRQRESDFEREKPFLPLLDTNIPAAKFVGGGFNLGPPNNRMSAN